MKAFRSGVYASALLASSALASPALAQVVTPPPSFTSPDQNNVDLSTGLVWFSMEEGGMGSGPGRVSMQRVYAEGARWVDNWSGGFYLVTSGGVTKAYINFGGISNSFTSNGTNWVSDKGDGSSLVTDSSGFPIYTAGDGTKITFNSPPSPIATLYGTEQSCPGGDAGTCHVPVSIISPNGLKFTLTYEAAQFCAVQPPGEPCAERRYFYRLSQVTSSAANQLNITYAGTVPPNTPPTLAWYQRTGVTFTNTVNPPSPLPSVTYAYGTDTLDVTDPGGRTWRFTSSANGGMLNGIRRPGSTSDNISYTYDTNYRIASATKDGVTDTYSFNAATGTMTRTDPAAKQVTVVTDLTKGRPTTYTNELGKSWGYQYDGNARLTRVTAPLGNYTQYAYDSRGNVTTVTNVASGTGLSNIVTSASFDPICSNIVKCNKPNTTTDAMGNITEYTYDPTHGGLTKVVQPAPATGAVRPETRYSYTQVTSATGDLVALPNLVSACQTQAGDSCTGTADETRRVFVYNSNLVPTQVKATSGVATLATSTLTYDARGNVVSVDGPLPGTDDTWAYKYDSADQVVGAISPDPDGSGSLKNRAIRISYRPDGQVSNREVGTTTGQTDTDFANMTVLQSAPSYFDSNSRVYMTRLVGGTSRQGQTQFSYDSLGRLDCTAVRMDRNQFTADASLSACTLGANAGAPDRITQNAYDAASRLTSVTVAKNTADAAVERTLSYTDNGMLATLKDGENNLTTFEYDGFDRLSKTRFPLPTKGSNASSTTDYELLTYDLNSNVTQRRLRDGGLINFIYDKLNRVTAKGAPNPEATSSFTYDNLGRTLTANKGGASLSFTYDALGRMLTQTGPQSAWTLTSTWDAAGRRTQLSYPGTGLFLNYDYLVTGEPTRVRENGATSGIGVLAAYGYDPLTDAGQLGIRTGITYGNGASQNFGYDSVSRLTSLTVDLSGTASDLTKTFAYNPANQIVTETRSNNAYAQVLGNGTQATVTNGLNQLSTVNGTSVAYDARGNMTSDPVTGKSYTYYGSNNQLYTVPSPYTVMSYDALDRLASVSTGSPVTNYVTDGTDIVAEYDGSNVLQKRYAFGTGGEPLVAYDASGNRTWILGDERGSVIALANDSAAMTTINTYDEYGVPGATNAGLLQYAGMPWLSGPGVYAPTFRAYAQHFGRFGQTDPIGMAGGINLYPYVGNDPINLIDPLGLLSACVTGPGTIGGVVVPGSSVTSCSEVGGDPAGDLGGVLGVALNAIEPRPPRVSRQPGDGERSPQNDHCPAVPSPGPGKPTIDQNIADAKLDAKVNALDPFQDPFGAIEYANNLLQVSMSVTDPADQNYKKNPLFPGSAPYGNFNFGATMQARGFSLKATLWYSNTFQRLTTGRADPAEDIADVSNGYKYAARGCGG